VDGSEKSLTGRPSSKKKNCISSLRKTSDKRRKKVIEVLIVGVWSLHPKHKNMHFTGMKYKNSIEGCTYDNSDATAFQFFKIVLFWKRLHQAHKSDVESRKPSHSIFLKEVIYTM